MTEVVTESHGKADAILNAAQRLFSQFGFRRTSMDDIAREAGIAKGTVYLYFEGKEAVFRDMQARSLARAEAACDLAEAAKTGFGDRLTGILEALYGESYDRYGQSEHLLELTTTRLTVGYDIAGHVNETYARRITEFLQAAAGTGEINLTDLGLDATSITAVLQAGVRGAKQGDIRPPDPATFRQRLAQLAKLTAAAVAPGPSDPSRVS